MATTPMDRHQARQYMHDTLFAHGLPSLRSRTGGTPGRAGRGEAQVLESFNSALVSALQDARGAALLEAQELLLAAQNGTMPAGEALEDAAEAQRFVAYVDARTT